MDIRDIIAHTSDIEGITQTLEDHTINVANKSKEVSKFPYTSYLVGLLHDLGKSDPKWQQYIRDGKGKVNHTSAGAKWVNDNIKGNKHYLGVLKYVITSHHGYYDSITEDRDTGRRIDVLEGRRMKYDEKDDGYNYQQTEDYFNLITNKHDINVGYVVEESKKEFINWVRNEQEQKINRDVFMYRMGLLIRYLLSVLKDADIEDTVTWDKNYYEEVYYDTKTVWDKLDERIKVIYEGFTEDTPINKERGRMSRDVLINGKDLDNGIVKLDMATGTGKTLTSMRYAVRQARKFNKKRIFYITPYLSVLEQNANVIREMVNDDSIILEHHSNIVTDDTEDNNKEFLKENWNSPILLTTMVQFFNTCFKGKSSNIRRFKAFEDSVIIIDEIQSLPPDKVSLINGVLNELATTYNSLIITCTATQPELDSDWVYEPIRYTDSLENGDLVTDTEVSKEIFKRTEDVAILEYQLGTEEFVDLIEEDINNDKNVLVILDLKKSVNEIYKECDIRGLDVIYLSTNLCAEHRIDIISDIKDKLERDESFVVVSTQLIEAGVDVDFNVVYRNVIGLDRIIQARGRCNREGKIDYGEMYVVDYEEVDLNFGAMRDLKIGQDVTKIVLKNEEGTRWEDIIPNYYNILYKNKLGKNGTKGNIRGERKVKLYDLLSLNSYMVNGIDVTIPQFFKTAYQEANLIEDGGTNIIVPYKESRLLIEELDESYGDGDIGKTKRTLRRLQRYTVNHYNTDELEGKGVYYEELGVFVLYEDYYDEEKGLSLNNTMETIVL